MRRLLAAVFILIIVGGASWFAYNATAAKKEPPPPDYEVYTVGTGDISAAVTATGSIEPTTEVNLSFKGAGKVVQVLVEAGDEVQAGQVLARLDTEDLLLARQQASIGQRLAEAQLAKAKRPAEAIDIAAAEAGLEAAKAAAQAAQAAYQDLLRGPTDAQRRAAEANMERARVMRDQAQSAYDQIAYLPNAGLLPQSLQLQQATIDYEVAQANVESTLAAATASQRAGALSQIAQAESAVAQSEASIERLKRGLTPEDLTILEVQVEQAGIAVAQSDLALKNAELVAPIDGTVGAVNIRMNEFPNPGLSAIVLTAPAGYHIELNVDEIDIGQLAVGQPAAVTVDALADAELTGVVSSIAPLSASGLGLSSGIVTYLVKIDLDEGNYPLRAGMTASVSITTAEVRSVMVLPNRVMRLDRQTGQTYVERLEDGVPRRTEIEIGLRNEQFSQILSGVQVGDELAVRPTDTGDVLRQQMFGG